MLPIHEMAAKHGLRDNLEPGEYYVDFRLDYVESVVTSGHKWIGAPYIILSRRKCVSAKL